MKQLILSLLLTHLGFSCVCELYATVQKSNMCLPLFDEHMCDGLNYWFSRCL